MDHIASVFFILVLAVIVLQKTNSFPFGESKSFDVVTLNVGGLKFQTLRKTLLAAPGTYFVRMLEEGSGEYFIDRDGKNFGEVLNYLRGTTTLHQVAYEDALFYSLPGWLSIDNHTTNFVVELLLQRRLMARKFLEKYEKEFWNGLQLSLVHSDTALRMEFMNAIY
jgi:hypothetical protein